MNNENIKQHIDNMIWHIETNAKALGEKKNVGRYLCCTKEHARVTDQR